MRLAKAAVHGLIGTISLIAGTRISLAADIRVIASNAVKEAYVELVPIFERTSGHKVATTWAGTNDIVRRVGGGEVFDLTIASAPTIDGLINQGRLAAGSRTDLVKSGVGVAVRANAPQIDISTGEAVKTAVLAAKSVAYSSGPSGVYMTNLFKRWGIDQQIQPKLKVMGPGMPVGDVVAKGEAEIGFQQMSELLPIKGIDILGPLPPEIQEITIFSVGANATPSSVEAAKSLVRFLLTPEAGATFKAKGLQPNA